MEKNGNGVWEFGPTPEACLEQGFSRLVRTAGAESLVVLLFDPGGIQIAYPAPRAVESSELVSAMLNESGPVLVSEAAGELLKSITGPSSNSFLLFPWQARSGSVAIAFGFRGQTPPACLSTDLMGSVNFAALAAWWWNEAERLRAELRVINHRFASRKLVERAKAKLQTESGMSEQEAYEHLRKLSRQRRITLARLAENMLRPP